MEKYNFKKIERKWQKVWEKEKISRARDFSQKPKKYILVEFPYPSGFGLHVGHCRPYIALDVLSRKKRMEGYNVLFPMGWDAFGLPTENFAIKTGGHPALITRRNTNVFKEQQKKIGLSFDWSREVNTTDSNYYKWTQWIFIQLFKKGLAYKSKMSINWCPSCKIGLANEEVVDSKCERCGGEIVREEREQWMLRITCYAERLIEGLDRVDYPERVKVLEKDWIGKSYGTEVNFEVNFRDDSGTYQDKNSKEEGDLSQKEQEENLKFIKVFTTRVDTIFGAIYLVLSPEHPFLRLALAAIQNSKLVEEYIEKAKKKLERERISDVREKTGVELLGVKAINPANKKEIPIFVADYVLPNYGTGAIMAVPAHDKRDFDFAKSYNLPIKRVISPTAKTNEEAMSGEMKEPYEGEGVLVNSGEFDGLDYKTAQEKILEKLERQELARKNIYYKLRDWVFSRQRYWGEPIPMINCPKCGWQTVPEKDLPVKLPKVNDYKPTKNGESPLAKNEKWVKTKCPQCKGWARREIDVMPNWAGSNWYFLRYCDPKNKNELASPEILKYWLPVDWYNGGMEHTTLHLLYSRFIYKFLWDIGVIPESVGDEPYKKRTSHGVILAEGGVKMSKSKGNVVTPDEIIKNFGADVLRTYEMFMGPFSQSIAWDSKGLNGVKRFLDKVWDLKNKVVVKSDSDNEGIEKLLHQTIKKVGEDIEGLKFNTAVSSLMILANEMERKKDILLDHYLLFLTILSPFAPHISEEIYQEVGKKFKKTKISSIFQEAWPEYKEKITKEKKAILVVQINGKVRDKMEIERGLSEGEIRKIVLGESKAKKWLEGGEIKKIIFIEDKLINFVI